mgnify:FL=1
MYPADSGELRKTVGSLLSLSTVPTGCYGGILAPVGSLEYAGSVTADAFKSVAECTPSLVVILSHALSTPSEYFLLPESSHFRTPLATVPVSTGLRNALLALDSPFRADEMAHMQEYGIEVLLPFVQTVFPGSEILPILTRPEGLIHIDDARETMQPLLHQEQSVVFVVGTNLCAETDRDHSRLLSAAVIDALLELNTTELTQLMNSHPVLEGLSAVLTCLGILRTQHEADLVSRIDSSAHDGDRINAVSYGAITLDIEP